MNWNVSLSCSAEAPTGPYPVTTESVYTLTPVVFI
jgi:hypothetical protein